MSLPRLSGGGGRKGRSRLPLLVEIALLVLLAWLLMKVVFAIITPIDQAAAVPLAGGGSGAPEKAQIGDYSILSLYDAFAGREVGEDDFDEVIIENVSETSLDITLLGVWANTDGTGSALISTGNALAEPYKVGDDIQSGVSLKQIASDRAIISRNGVNESVYLEGLDPALRAKQPKAFPAEGAAAPEEAGEVEGQLTLAKVADVMGMRPVRNPESGQIASYEIFPRDDAKFASLGFEEGDVIKLVNNRRAPTKPEQLKELLEDLGQASKVRFVVSRGGEAVEVVVTPSELY